MDVEKLFDDVGKSITPFNAMKLGMFTVFSQLAGQGWPDEVILSMAQDTLAMQGPRLDNTVKVIFDIWKAERSAT